MSAPNNGGPAYPSPVEFSPSGQVISNGIFGMSIRTAIAKGMMASLVIGGERDGTPLDNDDIPTMARTAYQMADALIALGTKDGGEL